MSKSLGKIDPAQPEAVGVFPEGAQAGLAGTSKGVGELGAEDLLAPSNAVPRSCSPEGRPRLPCSGAATLFCFGAVLGGVLWLLYSPAFPAPFYFDSWFHLVDKTNLHLGRLTAEALNNAIRTDYGGPINRPLSLLTLALTHYAAGLSPAAYRIGNLAIHAAATLALAFLLLSVLRTPVVRERHPELARAALPLALFASALWSLHPIQTNVATYVIQRMAGLAGLFTFLAAGAYVRARAGASGWSWRWGMAAAAFSALAVASKESGAVLPVLLGLTEWHVLSSPPRGPARRGALLFWAGAAALGLGLAVWAAPSVFAFFRDEYARYPFNVWERLLTEVRLQGRYLLVLLVPDPRLLVLDADIEPSRGLLDPPETLALLACLAAAIWLAIRLRRRNPLVALGVWWFLGAQVIEATFIPLDLYFEHRMYVPSAFLFLGAAALVFRAAQVPRLGRALSTAIAVAALSGEAAATYARNLVWADPVAFWADATAKAPSKARPAVNLGRALAERGKFKAAEEALFVALARGGDFGRADYNLADLYTRMGREEEAVARLEKAVTSGNPQLHWKANAWLALKAMKRNRLEEAERRLGVALAEKPTDAELWNLRGRLDRRKGRPEDADRAYRTALRYDPSNAEALQAVAAREASNRVGAP